MHGLGRSDGQGDEGAFRALFDAAPAGLAVGGTASWAWYREQNRLIWSRQAQRILGLEDTDADAGDPTSFFEGVHPDDRQALIELTRQTFEAGGVLSVDFRFVGRADGVTRWIHAEGALDGDRLLGTVADVSDRREAERELDRRAALLDTVQRIGRIGVWAWDVRTNRIEWSAGARSVYGLDDEAEGDPERFWAIVHPKDAVWLRPQVIEAFVEARTLEVEHRIVVDGEVRWVRARAEVERDENGLPVRQVAVVVDITASRNAQEALAEQTEALRRAHELARLGRFMVDLRTRTLVFAPEVARMVGLPETDLVHDVASFRKRFVHEEDAAAWARTAERLYRSEGLFGWDSRLRTVDGDVLWVRIRGRTELDDAGRPSRATGVVQDVTEHRELEERLLQAQRLDAVGQLAAGVAHDFNNLLTVIVGNTELALMRGGRQAELAEVLTAAGRAGDLVRQLLAFSRADSAEARVVDLNDAVRGVRRMLERLIESHIRVQATLIEAETPVLIDPGQLEQVLLNLAVNARDAMPRGGLLTISTRTDRSTVTLEVTDTGVGMDDATRARIFDPFYTTKGPGEGTGLGLATVYGIVTRAGGTIDVWSQPNEGTTFTISFPRVSAASAAAVAPAAAPGTEPDEHTGRVLVVEDDDMVRAVAAQSLERAGYEVVAATNGAEALVAVEEEAPFDLIVTDLMMPALTGVQLTAELEARGHSFPVVYTSGYPRAVADEAPGGPRAEFLPKPFSSSELASVVRRLLDAA